MREHMHSTKHRDKSKTKNEVWIVEFDSNMQPTLKILSKTRIDRKLLAECNRIEKRMFIEDVLRAQAKAQALEPLMLARSE